MITEHADVSPQHAPRTATSRWGAAHPPFAYSESRFRRLQRCPRAYYFDTYTSWQGWQAPGGTLSWLAYRCKKTVALPALLGTVVHDAMATCVRALTRGAALPPVEQLRADAARTLNAAWQSSRRNRDAFLAKPSRVSAPMLQEMLYETGPTAEAVARTRSKLDRLLENLHACGALWDEVRAAPAADVHLVDPFYSYMLPVPGVATPVQVYAAPDLIVRASGASRYTITDVKSGAADDAIDQILGYSVAASAGMGLDAPEGFTGQVIGLDAADGAAICRFNIAPSEVAGTVTQLHANVHRLLALAADPEINAPIPLHRVARARNVAHCRWCAHRGLCWPVPYRIRGAEAVPALPSPDDGS